MNIFPVVRETLILPYSEDKVAQILWNNIYPVFENEDMPDKPENEFLFNGWINKRNFQVIRKEKQAEYFSPIITGRIERSSLGSIIFVRYNLFRATGMLLILWSTLTLFLFFYFLILEKAYLNASLAIGLCILNYITVVSNFHIQVKKSQSKLRSIFK